MSKRLRLVLIVSILASFVAFLDGSVINVALPAITRELGGGLTIQQWVVDAYLITLGSLMLVAGSFSDIFGRKKILLIGLLGFGLTSLLCAVAPTGLFLVIARGLQGIAGALLVPSSLALIISSFPAGKAQGKAIGSWTAWTGISFIVGPLLGGFLVDTSSWRLIFAVNIVPILITCWLLRLLDEPEEDHARTKVDIVGVLLCSIGLGGTVFALIEQAAYKWSQPIIFLPFLIGIIALGLFVWYERQATHPMLSMDLFKVRNFTVGNIATALIYGGLSLSGFVITIFLQQVAGYSAVAAGLSLLPITIILFLLSSRFGSLSSKYGPRWFMSVGPILGGVGFLTMLAIQLPVSYWALLPGVLLFGLGLSITVAPLTAAILGAINSEHAGIASAINNAVARVAGLLAIAAVGIITSNHLTLAGFQQGLIATAFLLITGGVVSAIGITNRRVRKKEPGA